MKPKSKNNTQNSEQGREVFGPRANYMVKLQIMRVHAQTRLTNYTIIYGMAIKA